MENAKFQIRINSRAGRSITKIIERLAYTDVPIQQKPLVDDTLDNNAETKLSVRFRPSSYAYDVTLKRKKKHVRYRIIRLSL